jgi:STE24 endopeptidase
VVDPLTLFRAEEIQRARVYHRPLYLAWLARLAIELGLLAVLAFSFAGDRLFDQLDGLAWWQQTLAFTACTIALTTVATLPLSLWAGFVRERRWRLSTRSPGGFLADRGKALLVSLTLGGGALLSLVALARALPGWWPLAASASAAGIVLALGFAGPVLLEPLFSRFAPLGDEDLAASLRRLASEAGVPVERVLVADASRRTTRQNAYVSGLGRTRRLVLYDTLLADGSGRELRLVLAHELGHRRARHLGKGIALGAAGAVALVLLLWGLLRWPWLLAALGAYGPGDPRSAPFVLLLGACLQLAGAPAGAAVSRRWEREADRLSLELTNDPEAFEQAHRRLARANLADLDPPRLAYLTLFSHPTPAERIAAARTFAARG